MLLLREFEQEITRKPVFISSDLPFQLFDFNVIQISQICIQHDSMATDDTDGLLNSFSWTGMFMCSSRYAEPIDNGRTEIPFSLRKINGRKAEMVAFTWA